MLVAIQFPIIDLRLFEARTFARSAKPAWPIPSPGREFIRGVGGVEPRRLGGLPLIGEEVFCEASALTKIHKLPRLLASSSSGDAVEVNSKIAFRRVFSDGFASAKYEVAIAPRTRSWDYDFLRQAGPNVQRVLRTECIVPSNKSCALYNAGGSIASRYFLCSGVKAAHSSALDRALRYGNHVRAGQIAAVGEMRISPDSDRPSGYQIIPLFKNFSVQLLFRFENLADRRIPVWIIVRRSPYLSDPRSAAFARAIRLYLHRFYLEFETQRIVLKQIDSGAWRLKRGTERSDRLQSYLLNSCRRLDRIRANVGGGELSDAATVAMSCYQYVNPGWHPALLEKLERFDIRPQIMRRVEAQVKANSNGEIYVYGNLGSLIVTQDTYNTNQAGAVGPNATANNTTFHNQASQIAANLDLNVLAEQLQQLRSEMLRGAASADQLAAVAAIAKAEELARNGQGAEMMSALKAAGKWALDTATKVGVAVAAKAIEAGLGLK